LNDKPVLFNGKPQFCFGNSTTGFGDQAIFSSVRDRDQFRYRGDRFISEESFPTDRSLVTESGCRAIPKLFENRDSVFEGIIFGDLIGCVEVEFHQRLIKTDSPFSVTCMVTSFVSYFCFNVKTVKNVLCYNFKVISNRLSVEIKLLLTDKSDFENQSYWRYSNYSYLQLKKIKDLKQTL
jgi:hypothetical protein